MIIIIFIAPSVRRCRVTDSGMHISCIFKCRAKLGMDWCFRNSAHNELQISDYVRTTNCCAGVWQHGWRCCCAVLWRTRSRCSHIDRVSTRPPTNPTRGIGRRTVQCHARTASAFTTKTRRGSIKSSANTVFSAKRNWNKTRLKLFFSVSFHCTDSWRDHKCQVILVIKVKGKR